MRLKHNHIAVSIVVLTIARIVVNITRRFTYPFLPAIGRELGVSLAQVQGAVAVQGGVGIFSPLFGPLAERYGRKRVLLSTLVVIVCASGLGFAAPRFGPFVLVMVLFGLAKAVYDPAMQAYIGDTVAYARRARAIGVTELAWSLALIIGAPLVGYVLGTSGLRAVFALLLAASVGALLLLWATLPADHPHPSARATGLHDAWRVVRGSRAARAAVLFSVMFVVANEILLINYGVWMERTFALSLVGLGAATVVIALAEVVGEALVTAFADRLGKRRLVVACVLLACACYVALPHLDFSLGASLLGLFALFVLAEAAIVASVALFTEALPGARSVMMSSNVAAHSLGRLVGAQAGMVIYGVSGSFALIGIVAALVGALAAGVLWVQFDQD